MGSRLMSGHLGLREWVASTPWGDIRLSTPWGGLADSDGLIKQLALWCQQALVFGPAEQVAPRDEGAVQGLVSDIRLAPMGTEVALPWALLKSMPPPLPLQSASMVWPRLTFQVTVASLDEALIHPACVQEGGMVLLPEAFQPPWRIRLDAREVSCALWGHLHLNAGVIDLVSSVDGREALEHDVTSPGGSAWHVHLARAVVLDLPVAMGWIKGARAVPVDYSCDLDSLSEFGLSAELRHPQRGLMLSGMVVPVMLGAALCVRAVHTDF